MSAEIATLVEKLWQADDLSAAAETAAAAITSKDVDTLSAILKSLSSHIAARRVLEETVREGHGDEASLTPGSTRGFLMLLVLATYHSDSVLYLPPELRRKRITEWSDRTGYSVEIVKEAAILGSHGLTPLMQAA